MHIPVDNWLPRGPQPQSGQQPPQPMPPAVWRWLYSRGAHDRDSVQKMFAPSFKEMTGPRLLKDMDKGTERLVRAFKDDEHVCVYGDYDLDGSSGIALLTSGLHRLGFKNLSHYQPSRFKEGYGIHAEALTVIRDRGAKVVISVDCGITAIDEAKHAGELGLDLIITDHHQPRENLPDCLAVINPNRGDDEAGLGHLSGVGVGFYLLLATRRALLDDAALSAEARATIEACELKEELDLLALGTVADMVPLTAENKVLVKHGLKVLQKTQRPGLRALIEAVGLEGRKLTGADIAFQIAPKLNALARLELDLRPLDILMCQDPLAAPRLVQKVLELNQHRKNLQQEMETTALKMLDEKLVLNLPTIVIALEGGHPGVVGLVATKIVNLTQKPTFVVAFPAGDEMGVGSTRAAREADDVTRAMAAAAGTLERYGGHAQAGGFTVARSKFDDFEAQIISYYNEQLALTEKAQSCPNYYDTEIALHEITDQVLEWLEQAEPFGSSNPAPVFRVREAIIHKVRWLKDQHLKITLRMGVREIDCLAFFAKGLYEVGEGEMVEMLVVPSWNWWKGSRRLQLQIQNLRSASH